VIDLHAHVLPGLDDGPQTLFEAVEILRSMAHDGTQVVCATPHVRDDYPTTPEQMRQGLEQVRAAAAEAGLPIEVRPGGEVALDRLPSLTAEERAQFGLGGNPRVLLVEFPYYGWPLSLAAQCLELIEAGIVPVIAHPERNADVQEAPWRLEGLVQSGVAVQLTAASVDGRLGKHCARCARTLLEGGLAHVISSDAHAPWVRGAGMSSAFDAIGDPGLARWLVDDAPAALLAGQVLPPRPVARRRSRWRL
jgi:protein-tyrosine phosphatase